MPWGFLAAFFTAPALPVLWAAEVLGIFWETEVFFVGDWGMG